MHAIGGAHRDDHLSVQRLDQKTRFSSRHGVEMMPVKRWLQRVLLLSLMAVAACGGEQAADDADARIVLSVWAHSGQEAERNTLSDQVVRFNESNSSIRVKLNFIPESTYNTQVQAAALAGDLPDLLEFDGPYLYSYVWQGHLAPMDRLLADSTTKDLLPSIIEQGSYGGRLYSVGVFDSGLALYADIEKIRATGMRVPGGAESAWSIEEFNNLLNKLAEDDPDGAVLDLKLNYGGEWYTYAFSPVLQSAGADLIDRGSYQTAEGILNSSEAAGSLRHVGSWITQGRVDPNLDDAAFVSGRVAISWAGHWEQARYAEALGDSLVLLPLPDFGHGSRSAQGSWNWGISRHAKHPQAAAAFLEFLLQSREVLAITDANGAVPATKTAVAESALYGPQGRLRLFATQLLQGYTLPRPQTPAYPVITSAFQQAFEDIRNGSDSAAALDKAVAVIDQDIRDNNGYHAP
jgi:multiple sugar transport system substrate-binding protein